MNSTIIKSIFVFIIIFSYSSLRAYSQDKIEYKTLVVNRHSLPSDTIYEKKGELRYYIGSWKQFETNVVYAIFKMYDRYFLQKIALSDNLKSEYFAVDWDVRGTKFIFREEGDDSFFYTLKDEHLYWYNEDNSFIECAHKYEI